MVQPKYIREKQWVRYNNPHFLKKDKDKVIVLYNYIERRKSFFLRSFFKRNGFQYEDLGDYILEDVRWGKEYGNRMECNPMYFTGGSLIRNLFRIEKETGLTKEQIVEKYVFVGGGGQCGPCRYGMYPQEYWKALDDAGFKNFRLIIFTTGFTRDPVHKNSALKINLPFRIGMLHSSILADLFHAAECAIRPYAVDKESALNVISEAEILVNNAFSQKFYFFFKLPKALKEAGKMIASIPRKDIKLPKILVTGEIFANLAHNEGNYNIRRFIMDEECEALPGFLTQRIMYDMWRMIKNYDRFVKYPENNKDRIKYFFIRIQIKFRKMFIEYFWNNFIKYFNPSIFGAQMKFVDLDMFGELGKPYYDPEIFGGEGNLEIAEALYYADKVDGFISSKPFVCMPSSGVSDGVMAKVMHEKPELNFLSIETSGDNEVSILSRVSMLLFKAKEKFDRKNS
ncbi:MAG: hypothetical protein PF518_01430 [Spirochaetaceae bacterium]|jgi:predicted nucleotide-binding protein (sugar kinase/HSP70/actin superfamily)|nr:hypothetical protein [Spirochaetaceae bacterium]